MNKNNEITSNITNLFITVTVITYTCNVCQTKYTHECNY